MMRWIKNSIFVFLFFMTFYLVLSSTIGKGKFSNLKTIFNDEQKKYIKKFVFPYKYISLLENKIEEMSIGEKKNIHLYAELYYLNTKREIEIEKTNIKLSNDKNLIKYKLNSGFYYGIQNNFPGSGYIDFYNDDIFVLSSRGILAFKNLEEDKENFKQITNNINDFIGVNQFKKHKWFSLKDLFIFKNKILISYTEEIKEDCWNTSIIIGKINYEKIIFKKLFEPKNCIHSSKNIDNEFNAHQSGGKITSLSDDEILFTVGDYRNRYLGQDKQNVNGKIIKINILNGNYKIISIGHRNPQGIYYDKEKNFIIETEHGPMGGDEINLIEINNTNSDKTLNYGWPVVSAGEHYGDRKKNIEKYKKYPLYKSHTEHGFIEPLKTFNPSIGISEVVNIGKNKFVFGSMRDKSIYFFELNNKNNIINLKKVDVFERVRDLKYKNNKLFLFLENTASIGVINLI